MICQLQNLKVITKLKVRRSISDYFNQLNYMRQSITFFMFEEDAFGKNPLDTAMNMHEALLSKKVLLTKPRNKNKKTNYFDLD